MCLVIWGNYGKKAYVNFKGFLVKIMLNCADKNLCQEHGENQFKRYLEQGRTNVNRIGRPKLKIFNINGRPQVSQFLAPCQS